MVSRTINRWVNKVNKVRILHRYPELPKFLAKKSKLTRTFFFDSYSCVVFRLPFQIGEKVSVKEYNTVTSHADTNIIGVTEKYI